MLKQELILSHIIGHILRIEQTSSLPALEALERYADLVLYKARDNGEALEMTETAAEEYILSYILTAAEIPPKLTSAIIKYKPLKPAEPAQVKAITEELKARINRADKWNAETLEKLVNYSYLTNIPQAVLNYIGKYRQKDIYKKDPFLFCCFVFNIGKMYGIRTERSRRRGRAAGAGSRAGSSKP